MSEFTPGEWVRLPREFGHAEGQIVSPAGFPYTIFGKSAEGVYFPQKGSGILCDASWLTPIEPPRDYPDAPKWNPTSEGHPMVERNKAEVDMVLAYVRKIEFGVTEQNCWCPWKPFEVDGRQGRLRAGEHPQCPVHTKEGFLFGFIDHVRRTFADEATAQAYFKVLIDGEGTGQIKGFLGNPGITVPQELLQPPYGIPVTEDETVQGIENTRDSAGSLEDKNPNPDESQEEPLSDKWANVRFM